MNQWHHLSDACLYQSHSFIQWEVTGKSLLQLVVKKFIGVPHILREYDIDHSAWEHFFTLYQPKGEGRDDASKSVLTDGHGKDVGRDYLGYNLFGISSLNAPHVVNHDGLGMRIINIHLVGASLIQCIDHLLIDIDKNHLESGATKQLPNERATNFTRSE